MGKLNRNILLTHGAKATFLTWILILSICNFTCNIEENKVDSWTAQNRVNAAYFEKLQQCDQEQGLLILAPIELPEELVRLCEAELLTLKCPITEIPQYCKLFFIIM